MPDRQAFARSAFPDLHAAFGPARPTEIRTAPGTNPVAIPLLQARRSLSENLFSRDTAGSLRDRIERGLANARELAKINGSNITHVFENTGSQPSQFAQLLAFHHRSAAAAAALPDNTPNPLRDIDFHQILTCLADYPELMRRLGLVVELEIDEGKIPESPEWQPDPHSDYRPQTLRVIPVFTTALLGPNYSPFTAYILEGEHLFLPAPLPPAHNPHAPDIPPEFVAGMINLQHSDEYQAVEIDVDDAGLKNVAAVSANARLSQRGSDPANPSADSDQESSGGLPTLRSSGLGIVRAGHADVLNNRFKGGLQNNTQLEADLNQPPGTPPTVTLFAEDVTRGWRIDVLDTNTDKPWLTDAPWRSLHWRIGTFTFPDYLGGKLTVPITEEGMLQPALAQVVGNDGNLAGPEIYIHEGLFQWRGYSLAARRPGMAITQNNGRQDINNQPLPGGVPMAVNFQAKPGTLPRLRFGRNYLVRMRAVDLAGNSLSLEEANVALDDQHTLNRVLPVPPDASNQLFYKRFEPIPAPLLVPKSAFTEGESLAVLVIRSNSGVTAEQYAAELNQLVTGTSPLIYSGVSDRHLAPPKTSQLMAERFGLFDRGDADHTYPLAAREKGSLIDNFAYDANGNTQQLPPRTIETVRTSDDTSPVAGPASAQNPPKGFVVHKEEQLEPTYLPDPLSRGASLFDLPGAPPGVRALDSSGVLVVKHITIKEYSSLTQIDFGPPILWPNMRPFRLQLREDPIASGSSTPPAWDNQKRVLSVSLPPARKATAKLSSFLQDSKDVNDMLGLGKWLIDLESLDLAIAGFFWLLTPPRDITFVHAVQQPLADPLLTPTDPAPRDPGTTFTYFGGTATIHTRSTEKLDLIASWVDRLDDKTRPGSAHVFEVPIPEEATNPPPTELVPIATYGEDTVTFQAKPAGDPSGRKFLSRHEFGDTKHRQVTYQLVATSRFREYFPQKIITDFSRTGNAVVVNVPSSARPPAPGVLYALPVFEWTRTTNPDGSQSRVRKTSGIRVYLERPWYASGDGEMLAVVLADPSNYPPDEKLAPCVTQWGLDPIWDNGQQTGNVTAAPLSSHFGGVAVSGLALGELADSPTRVAIAAHGVEFESNRKLWYCDIPVDPGSVYCPFVRLALARYQQQSIPGLELSGVVLADFVQLLPQRTVSVQPVPGDPNSFTIALTGLTYAGSTWTPGPWPMPYYFPDGDPNEELLEDPPDLTPPYRIQVSLEQHIPGAQDDAGWQPAAHVAGAQVLVQSAAQSDQPGTDSLWSGKVTLPAGRLPGEFRAVIREYEQLFTDERIVEIVRVHVDATPPPRPKPARIDKRPLTWAPGGPVGPTPRPGRMVFAETIEL